MGGDGGERWAGSGLASRTRYLTFVLTPTPPKPGFQFTPSHPDTGVLAVVSEGPQGSWEPRSQMPSVSARSAAVTKYHTPGGLNHRHLCLIVLESGKAGIGLPPRWGPGVRMAAFWLCPHLVERELVSSSPYSDANLILRPLPSGHCLNLLASQRSHLQMPPHLG